MSKIHDLIRDLKSEEFFDAAKESYYFLTCDKENPNVTIEEYVSALRGLFMDEFITAKDDTEMSFITYAAKCSDIYAVDANSIYKLLETSKATLGEVIEKDYLAQITNLSEYAEDPLYKDISEYNSDISKLIRRTQFYYSINQIKKGNYKGPMDYRLSQKEIRTIENVKFIRPINKMIHDFYDEEGVAFKYCAYNKIPEDSILKRFAFHTDEDNPLFDIVFEDGTIVEYLCGDLRVLSYKFQELVVLTKLYFVQSLKESGVIDIDSLNREQLIEEVQSAAHTAENVLKIQDEVYTKKMIDTSKKNLENIKRLVKEYNL